MTRVWLSILNWNDAESTLASVRAVQATRLPAGVDLNVIVVDNGSKADDVARLADGLSGSSVELTQLPANTGFAAGHNLVFQRAIERGADYVWPLNNDATVGPDTLGGLLDVLRAEPRCGIVSPLIYSDDEEQCMDFVGAIHDWERLDSQRAPDPDSRRTLQAQARERFFVYGTAPLIRCEALSSLDDRGFDETYFAYFEDEDLGARLAAKGWTSTMAFDIRIAHRRRRSEAHDRPAYYFFLMARNSLLFYARHTPPPYRRLIRTRLLARSLIKAAQLRQHGLEDKSDACLLGAWHGLRRCSGPPRLSAAPPEWLRMLSRVFPWRLQQWLA
jgi:GT2 family glycosyltransferase